jgi:hypothetical protein
VVTRLRRETNGGYGIMVITGVCGTLNSGSIPGSRPNVRTPSGVFYIGAATGRRVFSEVLT